MTSLIVFSLVSGAIVALAVLAVTCYRKVGPNEVLIVSGRAGSYVHSGTGERFDKGFRIYHGGGTFVIPLKEKVDILSVELMTLEIRTPEFFTKFGVPIVVDGIAQIKVRSDDPAAIATAAEMFLSKSTREMNDIAHQMMQGHLRAVISTLPFEEIHANPEAFAQTVHRLTAADLANMGIQVVSFTIREIKDPNGYLQAVGRPQLAHVQMNAEIGEAVAQRDAAMGRAGAEREAQVCAAQATRAAQLARIEAEVAVADAQADKERRQHALSGTVSESKASSDLAYELASAREQHAVMEARLLLDELRIRSRQKQLALEIDEPAAAERRRIVTMAGAEHTRVREIAEAGAEAARATGFAEADVIRARGAAEAERLEAMARAEAAGLAAKLDAEAKGMRQKADAWQRYGSAALGQLLIDRLPEIASAVSAPLANIERIVLVGQGSEATSGIEKITGSVTSVLAQLPALAATLGGVDLRELLSQLPGLTPSGMLEANVEPDCVSTDAAPSDGGAAREGAVGTDRAA